MKKLFELIEGTESKNSKRIDTFLLILISLNILLVIIDSYGNIRLKYNYIITIFETISVIIFTLEYILRMICSPYRYSDQYNKTKILRYIITPMAIIDLLAILPFYLPLVFVFDFRFLDF